MSNTSYYLYQKYIKYGSQDWIPVYPAEYAISGDAGQNPVIKLQNDPNCGFYEPQYRWHQEDISEAYICSGGNKYYEEIYQVSYDNGFNWENVVPEQTRQGELYEEHSDDCNDYPNEYLTFIPISASSTFQFTNNVDYSLDNGSTWATLAANTPSPSVNAGKKIMWKGELTPSSSNPYGIGRFSSSDKFNVECNAMSLLYGDNFVGQTSLAGKNYAFSNLFSGCTNVVSAENLILPATTLVRYCYYQMFRGCTSLTTAPELPAMAMREERCYYFMFYNCTSLTSAPELPATTLTLSCYEYMFAGCTSLTETPELSATTLAGNCYSSMFERCTSLTTAPELPATTLADNCYQLMFRGCTSLTSAPVLSATTLANGCYHRMFNGCTSLTTAPELPAATLVEDCYNQMFYNCSSLNSITCFATDISASSCTTNWTYNVANSGTFTKAASMTSWTRGYNGIPNNWTVVNA